MIISTFLPLAKSQTYLILSYLNFSKNLHSQSFTKNTVKTTQHFQNNLQKQINNLTKNHTLKNNTIY